MQRAKIPAAIFALLVLATIILALSQRAVQAQTTPNLSVPGAIFGGTKLVNTNQGPVPPCYLSAGTGCDGKFHVVNDHTTATISGTCNSNQLCNLGGTTYITVVFSGASAFDNNNFTCSATIFTTSPAAYIGYCQPAPSPSPSSMYIYMYNPGSSVSGSVSINYTASGI